LTTASLSVARGDRASVNKDFSCFVREPDDHEFLITTDSQAEDTQSNNKNTNLRCIFDESPTSSGHAELERDFTCFAGGFTSDSQVVQTPNGKVILQCHNNNK
jgi:hypothetical protein